MGTSKFDALTRSLATSTSRRRAMGVLFAGAVGGVLGASGIGKALAAANCSSYGTKCAHARDCCSGDCFNGKCSCKAKGVICGFDRECCSGNCMTFAVAPNSYCA
ncbi:hypothetical protein KDA_43170 [Dictyobacter alpinus]|uniref:Uncharacterized protein n=1 Tax=Dictyobacter alpinus TaxID=2014873 RepID=A0A402BBR4_9CHLR|nr:hypothetical protein [Dictyobacter alpinus]GCE28833.1 hypothetical protein KDA_43170 [Dictyobacter alpinus]